MNHAFLNRSYNRDEFINFAKEFLPDFGYEESSVRISHNSLFNSAQTLGSALGGELAILEIAADSTNVGKRIAITKEAFKILRDHGMSNALVAFDDGHGKWRLSLLTTTLKLNDAGKVVSEASNPRRYSYLLGVGAKTVTPYKYLIEKGKVEDIKQLQERFSVEVVNKQFYASIADLFTKLVGGKRGATEYPGLLKIRGIVNQNVEHQEFAVRLIGRVIFGWFLKEKKSAAGIPIVPNELLSLDAVASNADYYHSMLEPLFFELLNKRTELRHESLRESPFSTVPYLNGGLFSPQDNDFYDHNSFNSTDTPTLTHIPDSWFTELFTVLEQYNFTVDENTSYDVDLSIDPEMLGRIFENLLAEINPETGESARKSTGSFYTPREIVDYMVDSSLLEYLKIKTSVNEDKLKALISWNQDDDDDHPLAETEKKNIVDALATLTILDPACGSGAFPIGILQKVVYILQQVDQEGKLWLEKQLAGNASPEFRRFLEQQNYDYIRKLGIIRESIFGVDIQTIATEISKLRCFLTLVIEEDVNDDLANNRGIQPLPNLEFKFVTANSLIGLNESEKVALGDEKLEELESKLFELRTKRYFQTKSTEEKEVLRKEDKQLCRDILLATAGVVGMNEEDIKKWEKELAKAKNELSSLESQFIEKTQGRLFGEDEVTQLKLISIEENNLKQKILSLQHKIRNERKKTSSPDLAKKLQLITSWSPYDSGSSANFFDSKWMFGVDNFDLVIANPPYVQVPKADYSEKFYPYSAGLDKGKQNLYKVFIEHSYNVVKDTGIVCLITQSSIMADESASGTRKLLIDASDLLQVVEFPKKATDTKSQVFESVLQGTCVLIYKRSGNTKQTKISINNDRQSVFDPSFTMISAEDIRGLYHEALCIPLIKSGTDVELLRKLQSECIELRNYIQVSQQGDFNLGNDKKHFGKVKTNIEMWRGNGFGKYTQPENRDKQGEAEYILDNFKLERVNQNESNVFLLSHNISGTTDESRLIFTVSTKKKFLCGDSINKCLLSDQSLNMTALGILNSKLLDWYFRLTSTNNHVNSYEIERLPFPKNLAPTPAIDTIVGKIMIAKESNRRAKTKELEAQIDQLVYELYNLSPEEITIIEDKVS